MGSFSYPGSEQGVFIGAGDAHSQGIISWLYRSQLAEANMAHAGFHSLCLFVQGGMQAQVIHGVFDPRCWNSSMNDRAKLSLINNNIFFQGSLKAIECSRTGSHQPGQQNFRSLPEYKGSGHSGHCQPFPEVQCLPSVGLPHLVPKQPYPPTIIPGARTLNCLYLLHRVLRCRVAECPDSEPSRSTQGHTHFTQGMPDQNSTTGQLPRSVSLDWDD